MGWGSDGSNGAWRLRRWLHDRAHPSAWLAVWLAEVFVAVAIAAPAAATKARRANSSLFSGPGRKFAFSFAPPIIVGGLLTFALYQMGAISTLPAVWLLLYGTAIVTGGAFSVTSSADYGVMPDGFRYGSAVFATAMGEHFHGSRIWSSADGIWIVDRLAVRRVKELAESIQDYDEVFDSSTRTRNAGGVAGARAECVH